jgi:hypothetical protein
MLRRLLASGFLLGLAAALAQGEERAHWAYHAPLAGPIPGTGNPVDVLLGQARKAAGVREGKLAEPRRWVERAAFTLTGLPPTLEQIRRIQAMPDEPTWAAMVDEMLASRAYGERWARHWMDVARYADTRGYHFDRDNRYPFAYTYRDWLIGAFNQDIPFERFIKLQIAADLVVAKPDDPDLAALGFLTVGLRGRDADTLDDRVDVVTRGFMSTTLACARCHDHKSDPITQRDYYSIYSIFENAAEPDERPVIGVPGDKPAYEAYLREAQALEAKDLEARQELLGHLRDPAALAVYLKLAWEAQKAGWDQGRATAEAFKHGRYRGQAVIRWRDFLQKVGKEKDPSAALIAWNDAMDSADDARRGGLCRQLAASLLGDGDVGLAGLKGRKDCPLGYGVGRMSELFDVEDANKSRERESAMSKLQAEHPGSPPRAMSVKDPRDWKQARIFLRGDPANPGEKIERQWLGMLGGGAFQAGRSPRLAMAEKIADLANNPLTARAWVNRVWAWNFGAPLADPGDFGIQQPEPRLLRLMDWLALEFARSGGSTKQLQRTLLTSRAFRLAASGEAGNARMDEGNTTFWRWNRRRADFESMRDRLLMTSGSLNLHLIGGRSVKLDEPAADERRSVYGFVDRFELPGTFVTFDLPHPDHHSAGRIETTVPQQALFFLNSPLLIRQAEKLAQSPELAAIKEDAGRIGWIYARIFQRAPKTEEIQMATRWLAAADPTDYQPRLGGYWEILHGEDLDGVPRGLRPLPMFDGGHWKTGKDLATAPIPYLHAGAKGAHPAPGYALVARWLATGPGEVRLVGDLDRRATQGNTLAWEIRGPNNAAVASGKLTAPQKTTLESSWVAVKPGEPVDFVLRAPDGANSGATSWNLRVVGRETPAAEEVDLGSLQADFPAPGKVRPGIAAGDPWADLIQMLWASNGFNFID